MAAYNFWGGGGFYPYANGSVALKPTVSFLRPNPYATPVSIDNGGDQTGQSPYLRTEPMVPGELHIIDWLEKAGYVYATMTDGDVDQDSTALTPAKYSAVVLGPHSEYWSANMYRAVARYLQNGGSLVILGGNTAYRHVAVDAVAGTLSRDREPTGTDAWTPFEQAKLLGEYWDSNDADYATCFPYKVLAPADPLFAGTGVVSGSVIGASTDLIAPPGQGIASGCSSNPNGVAPGASGWEVDRKIDANAGQVLHRTYTDLATGVNPSNGATRGDIVYYEPATGGRVLNVGSISFAHALAYEDSHAGGPLTTLVKNTLNDFATSSDAGSFDFGGLVSGDYDNDKKTDLLARNGQGQLFFYRGTGTTNSPTFLPAVLFNTGWGVYNEIIGGDFDADSRPDVLARTPAGALFFYRGTGVAGTPSFSTAVQVGTGWQIFNTIIAGDFDNDGHADLIGRKPTGDLVFYRGSGTANFSSGVIFNAGWDIFSTVIPIDGDHDGHPDLIAPTATGELYFYKNIGSPGSVQFAAPTVFNQGWQVYNTLVAGDFDSSGQSSDQPDLLARDSSGGLYFYRGQGSASGPAFGAASAPFNIGWQVYE